jgi:diaminohydroxyphosphoribosylaminopyrimidine deaminase/5-amino-6-(5-phosphoribosylamino)uracil reductase
VVVSNVDPNPLVNGKSIKKMQRAGISVKTGVLKKEGALLNEVFFKFVKKRMPFVAVKFAQSVDGRINTHKSKKDNITSLRLRRHAKKIRSLYDAVCVGVNTVIVDNPFLDSAIAGKEMVKVVLDPFLKTPPYANIFKKGKVFLVSRHDARKKNYPANTAIIRVKSRSSVFSLNFLLKELGRMNITSLFVEGGGKTIGEFIKQKLADKIYAFIAPKIIGKSGTSSVDIGLPCPVRLRKTEYNIIGGEVILKGYLLYGEQ